MEISGGLLPPGLLSLACSAVSPFLPPFSLPSFFYFFKNISKVLTGMVPPYPESDAFSSASHWRSILWALLSLLWADRIVE